jgi:O-antigen/teichoic acid export membrane protein
MLAGPLVVFSLPGTFGRYAEYYRQRGRLRPFLLQTTIACATTAVLGVGLIVVFRSFLSTLIFDSPDHETLVLLLAGSLLIVVAYNYSLSLFTALRTVRLASAMEFVNGVMFAVLGILLLIFWRCDASAVILAYGGAGLICVLGASYWYRKAWKIASVAPTPTVPLETLGTDRDGGIWRKLIPFTSWLLLINMLTNLYGYTDRYLILHFSSGDYQDRLATVGQYFSARVVPLLLVSLAAMISGILLPHLSHDWESNRRDRVSFRLNLFMKLATVGLFAVGTVVLAAAPLLFEVAFRGKYAEGSAALPGMLVATVWFGSATIAQQYLWCAERAGAIGFALAVGLAVNVTINLLLLPTLGLTSAVLAAIAANLVTMLLVLYCAKRLGFEVHRGVWLLLAAPATLYFGTWAAIIALTAVAVVALRSEWIFNAEEKEKIAERWEAYWPKFSKYAKLPCNIMTRRESRPPKIR